MHAIKCRYLWVCVDLLSLFKPTHQVPELRTSRLLGYEDERLGRENSLGSRWMCG